MDHKFSTSCFSLIVIATSISNGQVPKYERLFQFSLAPGLGTNGLHPGGYKNYFSLNLTSGYSKENRVIEIGVFSNLNEEGTRGIQLAGLANLTGANAFSGLTLKEIDLKKREGFEANLTGAQVSGFVNYVLNNTFGFQASGGFNVAHNALFGFQLAGLSNTVVKYSFGLQLAGVYNISAESMDGVQLSGLFNLTRGGLYGLQLGAVNTADFTEGVNSSPNNFPTGVQIGIVNTARKMNGFQIGLINFAGKSQGTQIGLINIFGYGRDANTRDGTAIGLLNLGDFGYLAAYATETFVQNYELSSGVYYKNTRLTHEYFNKTVQNALIYSRTGWNENDAWAIGYGLKKMYFKRSAIPGMMDYRFFSYGLDVQHVSHSPALEKNLSLRGQSSRPGQSYLLKFIAFTSPVPWP